MASFKNRNGGFSLIELLIVAAIGLIATLGVGTLIVNLVQEQSRAMSLLQLNRFQRSIIQSLTYDLSWDNTIQAGTAAGLHPLSKMDCLSSAVPCTVDGTAGGAPIQNQAFALYDTANRLVFNSLSPTNGLTLHTNPCNSFSATGNDNCPYRYDLEWSALCEVGNCVNPLVKISAKFSYSPLNNRNAVNPLNYTIESFYKLPVPLAPPPPAPGNSCAGLGPAGRTINGGGSVTVSTPINVTGDNFNGVVVTGTVNGDVTIAANVTVSGARSVGVLVCGNITGILRVNAGVTILVTGGYGGVIVCGGSGSINNAGTITASGGVGIGYGSPKPPCL